MLFLLDIQNLALLTDLFLHSRTSFQRQVFVIHLRSPGLTGLTRTGVARLLLGCSKPWVHPMFPPVARCSSSPGAVSGTETEPVSGTETCWPGLEQDFSLEKAVLNWGRKKYPFLLLC